MVICAQLFGSFLLVFYPMSQLLPLRSLDIGQLGPVQHFDSSDCSIVRWSFRRRRVGRPDWRVLVFDFSSNIDDFSFFCFRWKTFEKIINPVERMFFCLVFANSFFQWFRPSTL